MNETQRQRLVGNLEGIIAELDNQIVLLEMDYSRIVVEVAGMDAMVIAELMQRARGQIVAARNTLESLRVMYGAAPKN